MVKKGAKTKGRAQGLMVGAIAVVGLYEYYKRKMDLAAVAEQELLAGMKKATQASTTPAAGATPTDEATPASGTPGEGATPEADSDGEADPTGDPL